MAIRKVCVYCASSTQCDALYVEAARELGVMLARNSITIVYGAGAVGSMGQLAEGRCRSNIGVGGCRIS